MSRKITRIDDPDEMPIILDLIHDRWFDVDDIEFNADLSVLSIKFGLESKDGERVLKRAGPLKKVETPVVEAVLRIHHVKSYSINDTERVGVYDFNMLEYDAALKRVRITTGVPIGIEALVERFEVSVEETDNVTEVRTSASL